MSESTGIETKHQNTEIQDVEVRRREIYLLYSRIYISNILSFK